LNCPHACCKEEDAQSRRICDSSAHFLRDSLEIPVLLVPELIHCSEDGMSCIGKEELNQEHEHTFQSRADGWHRLVSK